ncbi:MAG TPA: hypothetical protein VFR17_00155 [Mycobacterium sp.]|nr:hypothetical protein [Mycobacterium sp.]
MAWFLALQGPPNKLGQSPTYELQESADVERITEEMASSAVTDRAVAIPALLQNGQQKVTLYVRPAAWGAWAFYQLTEEEKRKMLAANPLINAIAQARAAKQQPRPQQPPGPATIPRLE